MPNSHPDSSTASESGLGKGLHAQNRVEHVGTTEEKSTPDPETHEGGTKAWLTVAGSAAGMFVSFGWVNCIGLFQAEYETNQLRDYSSSDVAWITSLEFFFMLAFSPVAGKLFDRYGPRVPIAIGSVMHVFGLMMTSISSKYYQIMLSQSVCSGIGSSLIFTPSMTAPQTWFRKKRGIVGGLVVAGSSLGGVIFPLMVQHLIPSVGFGWAMRICAFLIVVLLVFTSMTVSSGMKHAPRPFAVMDYVRPLKEANFIIMCASSFFLYWGMFVPFDYIVLEAVHYGMSAPSALSLIPIMNGASFVGRTVPNYIADKVGRFNVMIVMTLLSGIVVLALWLPGRGDGAFISFAVLFGITSGAGIGLAPVLIASISPMKDLGFRMGTILAIAAIGALTSPPIAGAIVASDGGSYTWACVFSGINFIIAAVGVFVLQGRLCGWKLPTRF